LCLVLPSSVVIWITGGPNTVWSNSCRSYHSGLEFDSMGVLWHATQSLGKKTLSELRDPKVRYGSKGSSRCRAKILDFCFFGRITSGMQYTLGILVQTYYRLSSLGPNVIRPKQIRMAPRRARPLLDFCFFGRITSRMHYTLGILVQTYYRLSSLGPNVIRPKQIRMAPRTARPLLEPFLFVLGG